MAKDGRSNRAVGSLVMDIEEGPRHYEVSEEAFQDLIDRGLKLPERPDSRESEFVGDDGGIIMPSNLVDLSDEDLGELYGVLEQYYAYAAGQLALVKNSFKESDKQHRFIAAKVRLGKDGTEKGKDAKKLIDRRFVISEAEAFKQECLHNLIAKVVEAAEADLKFVSRSISIRDQRLKSAGRAASIGARRASRQGWSNSTNDRGREVNDPRPRTEPRERRPATKGRRAPPKRRPRR